MPMIIQTINLIQVSKGKNTIINRQTNTPSTGIKGTSGTRKALGAFGIVFRSTNTPRQTNINANKVPILVISPTTLPGTKAANKLMNTKKNKFDLKGVLSLECKVENNLGTSPSLLIE